MIYLTTYRSRAGLIYGSAIQAATEEDAQRYAIERGMQETILGTCEDYRPESISTLVDLIHYLVFLAQLTPQSTLLFDDDVGVLHSAVHVLTGITSWDEACVSIQQQYTDLVSQIPGYAPTEIDWDAIG